MANTQWFIDGFKALTGETYAGATRNGEPISAEDAGAELTRRAMLGETASVYQLYALDNQDRAILAAAEWLLRSGPPDSNFYNSLRDQFGASGYLSKNQIALCRPMGRGRIAL